MKIRITLDSVRDKNLKQMKQLNDAIFPVKYKDKFYSDCIACGDVTQLAYYNDILIGAIACRLESKGNGKAKLYIMTLGVLAPYRDLGVGSYLLNHSLSVATEDSNIEEAYLHVQTNNEGAIRFYDKHGFSIKEMIPNYYKRIDPPDCYILEKTLVSP